VPGSTAREGYKLWFEVSVGRVLWRASKQSHYFLAYSGPELLGIVALWERYGEEGMIAEPDILAELSANAIECDEDEGEDGSNPVT